MTQVDENASAVPPAPGNKTKSTSAAVISNLPTNIFRIPPPTDNKKRRQEQADEAFKTMREIRENACKRDEYTVFGELIANKLRKFSNSPRSVAIAQRAINDILFNLEMQHYGADTSHTQSNDSVTFNTFHYNQYNSPSNASTSSSPSIISGSVHNLQQPNQNSGLTFLSSPLINVQQQSWDNDSFHNN